MHVQYVESARGQGTTRVVLSYDSGLTYLNLSIRALHVTAPRAVIGLVVTPTSSKLTQLRGFESR